MIIQNMADICNIFADAISKAGFSATENQADKLRGFESMKEALTHVMAKGANTIALV